MSKWRNMSKRERRAWVGVLLVGPLGFIAVGVALSGVSAGGDGEPIPAVLGVAVALLLVFWLGRRSRADNTAVAVAQAVSVAVADATAVAAADARAQALNQVAVIVGGDRSHELVDGMSLTDGEMLGLESLEVTSALESSRGNSLPRPGYSALDLGTVAVAAGMQGAPQSTPEGRVAAAEPVDGDGGDARGPGGDRVRSVQATNDRAPGDTSPAHPALVGWPFQDSPDHGGSRM